MIYIYNDNKVFHKQICYTFHALLYALGIEYRFLKDLNHISYEEWDIIILYSMDDGLYMHSKKVFNNIIHLKPCTRLFGEYYMKPESIPCEIKKYAPCEMENVQDIISIYNEGEELYIRDVKEESRIITTNIDFISDAFFMLSRYEEVVNWSLAHNERYGRFPAAQALSYKFGFLERPIVNEYIELLWEIIKSFGIGIYIRKKWLRGRKFAACLSHDVDMPTKYKHKSIYSSAKTFLSMLLKQCSIKKSIAFARGYIKHRFFVKDLYWTFDKLIELENSYGFYSSFYFMGGGTSDLDSNYINRKEIKSLIELLYRSGFEVGYHGSVNSFLSPGLMKLEKRKLDVLFEGVTLGSRQHFLMFRPPYTWRYQEDSGLLYDTSMGFPESPGFRSGICFPYKPYDLLENRVMDIWEIPLIAMDTTMYSYLKLSKEETLDRIIHLIDTVRRYEGVFTLLVHNNSFEDFKDSKWDAIYEEILCYVHKNHGAGLRGRDIIDIFEGK